MSTLGTVLLAAGLALAMAGALLWVRVARSGGDPGRERTGRRVVLAALGAVACAVAVVEVALLRSDPDLAYVEQVAGPELPLYYRFTALWSALEGSLLLWLLTLSAVAAAFVFRPGRLPVAVRGTAAAVLCGLVAAFAVVALVASPFTSSAGPPPSPLLQDHPAMGVHPPLLYAGFAGLAIPYALSVGALTARAAGPAWARVVRGWTLAAWVLLTLGILLGAWWSYAVLGWGGYWAWDPVENASLMPWLVATALLHTVGAGARGGAWRAWSVSLAGAGFLLVLVATFLTRSGVVASIHAFSTSPLGPLLLGVLAVALLPWLALLVARRDPLTASAAGPLLSRPAALRANRIGLVLVTAIVLVGSVTPAVLLAVGGDRLSVGPPWYGRTLAPLAVLLLVLMALAPWLSAGRDELPRLLHRVRVPALAAAAAVGAVGLTVRDLALAATAGLAAFVLAGLVLQLAGRAGRAGRDRRAIGSAVAHLGVALGAVAVVAGGLAVTTQETVPVGGSVAAGTTTVTLVGLDRADEGRRSVAEARLLLARDGELVRTVHPQLRWYEDQNAMLAGPEITVELFRDVYVTLLDVDPDAGTATVRLAVNPLTSWLWAAGALTAAGGAIAGWPRRRRGAGRPVPAPRRDLVAAGVPATPQRPVR